MNCGLPSPNIALLILLASIATIVLASFRLLQFRRESRTSREKSILGVLVFLACLALIFSGWTIIRGLMRLGEVDSAIVSMRSLVAAESKFAEDNPDIGYTCTLSALASDESIGALPKNGQKNAYAFEITGCRTGTPNVPNPEYRLTARPLRTEMPAFCANQSGILRYDESGSVEKCLQGGIPIG